MQTFPFGIQRVDLYVGVLLLFTKQRYKIHFLFYFSLAGTENRTDHMLKYIIKSNMKGICLYIICMYIIRKIDFLWYFSVFLFKKMETHQTIFYYLLFCKKRNLHFTLCLLRAHFAIDIFFLNNQTKIGIYFPKELHWKIGAYQYIFSWWVPLGKIVSTNVTSALELESVRRESMLKRVYQTSFLWNWLRQKKHGSKNLGYLFQRFCLQN